MKNSKNLNNIKFAKSAHLLKIIKYKSGLNQKEIAKLMKVHFQLVSNIGRGLCGFPAKRINKLLKYASLEYFEHAAVEDFRAAWRKDIKTPKKVDK